ncbi:hypothetical protein [Mesoterricola sediminis]|uniref:Uncharacterized protein n=1 Tax=Mesoterricola sediminis TaxID=2927980 RepID=A0AA48KDG8_9BACT|nr:hypothetical protein [Mesoterricola sediminis]BDU76312.1 hypothetical protein METESE_12700 [Mesoterricola sediminis]
MKTALIALWGLVAWLLVEMVVFLPLYLLGLVLMPILLRWAPRTVRPTRIPNEYMHPGGLVEAFAWDWADALWGNKEDGLLPWWWEQKGGTAWGWFLRNPVCNMRFWPIISTLPSPSTQYVGTLQDVPANGDPGWFLAWAGPYVGFLWQNTHWGLWIGWKINPRDARRIDPEDYRTHGLGTACQFMRF